ncbi:MAG: FkbM family methyltransferase [Bacteroidales bacterium]|nr:FkbM family methyltransferase [Bacteroidales bacterium]
MESNPLSVVLDKHMPKDIKKIDFMSIDVEGLDLEVLESNDWEKYKPTVILIESLSTAKSISDSLNSTVAQYLATHNYSLCSKLDKTLFFMLNE